LLIRLLKDRVGNGFDSLVKTALSNGASDLHLEAGLPPALRIRGTLRTLGEPLPGKFLLEAARALIGEEQWLRFLEQRSFDLSRTIQGVRCRINVLHTARGIGFAIRLLASFQATVERLNLHPDLKKLVAQAHGLILVSGPTGCGKSSTLAALIQEINLTDARHVVTIESPIEYTFVHVAPTYGSAKSAGIHRASSKPCSTPCAKIRMLLWSGRCVIPKPCA